VFELLITKIFSKVLQNRTDDDEGVGLSVDCEGAVGEEGLEGEDDYLYEGVFAFF
jgi:hypothetical protein